MTNLLKRLGKPFLWLWGKIKRYRYYILTFFAINLLIWLVCLPDQLFKDPTCTVLTDREGNILGARIADDGQWRFPARTTVPYKFRKAIIQFEDRRFYEHPGISIRAFARAIRQNVEAGEVVSGGSTISMQTIRLSRKGKSRSVWEKLVEVFQSTRMESLYSKEEILAMYASNAPMGGNVIGLDAAAWRYFGRKANDLSWAEAATLAILPNAPGLIHPGKNRATLLSKRNRLLDRLYQCGELDELELKLAKAEPIPEAPPNLPDVAPHLMDRLISEGHKGQWIETTINQGLQEEVNRIVAFHKEHLAENEINNAAVVVLDVETGNVLAYIGNTRGDDPADGNSVDIIRAPRSTGSIMKPFLYAAMLDAGELMPDQLVEDVPAVISGYSPKNYNDKYDGAVPASRALSRSLNVPIINMLQAHGVQKFHHELNRIGLTTITRPSSDYGLTLVLGGAEATLWDLSAVYMNMARTLTTDESQRGFVNPSYSVQKRGKASSQLLFTPAASWATFQAMLKVARPAEEANWTQFSSSQKIAWKTGTSYGFRDAWAIGVTPRYVVGVWVGNADGEGRPGLVGFKAAAPILFDVFDKLDRGNWFYKPTQDMEAVAVCRHSGFRASAHCTSIDTLLVPKACLNTTACPHHKIVHLDKSGQYRVNSSCEQVHDIVSEAWFVLPPLVEKYYRTRNPNYKELPPYKDDCQGKNSDPVMALVYPKPYSNIYIPVNLDGTLSKTIFEATHRGDGIQIYWHLDEKYIGSTKGIHQLEFIPEPGEHVLRVIDEYGNEIVRRFEVSGKAG